MANLSLELAQSASGVLILGALAVKQLKARGMCAFYVNSQGTVEIVEPLEFALDALPEDQALRILLERQYTDTQLTSYLRGRESRLSPRGRGDSDAKDL
jgi:hypothetical protein